MGYVKIFAMVLPLSPYSPCNAITISLHKNGCLSILFENCLAEKNICNRQMKVNFHNVNLQVILNQNGGHMNPNIEAIFRCRQHFGALCSMILNFQKLQKIYMLQSERNSP